VLTWLLALTATHVPAAKITTTGMGDKKLHAVGYFVLGIAFTAAMAGWGVGRGRRALLVAGVLAVYGALDELTQPLVNRHASPWDWLADLAGIAAAVLLWEALVSASPRRSWLSRLEA